MDPTPTASSTGEPRDPELEALRQKVRDGVRAESDTRYVLSRDAFEQLRAKAVFVLEGRLVPKLVNGEVIGLQLFGIRAPSVLEALGLRNGDVLLDINGHGLKGPADLLELYSSARQWHDVAVSIERDGRRTELSYREANAPIGRNKR